MFRINYKKLSIQQVPNYLKHQFKIIKQIKIRTIDNWEFKPMPNHYKILLILSTNI